MLTDLQMIKDTRKQHYCLMDMLILKTVIVLILQQHCTIVNNNK